MQPSSRTKSAGASSGTTFISKRLSWSPRSMTMQQEAKIRGAAHKTMKGLRESPQNFDFNGPVPHVRVLKFPAEDQCGQESNFHLMENTLKFAPYCPPHYLAVLQGYPSFSHTPTLVSSIRIGAGYLCQS